MDIHGRQNVCSSSKKKNEGKSPRNNKSYVKREKKSEYSKKLADKQTLSGRYTLVRIYIYIYMGRERGERRINWETGGWYYRWNDERTLREEKNTVGSLKPSC